MSENTEEPDNSSDSKSAWGWGLLGGGCLTALIALGSAATAGIVLFGDLASGGMVPGHGQDEINRSVAMAAIAPIFLVLGFVAAVVGLALLTLKRMK